MKFPKFSKVRYQTLYSTKKSFLGVDTNGDHVIDFDEFIVLLTKKIILNEVEKLYA